MRAGLSLPEATSSLVSESACHHGLSIRTQADSISILQTNLNAEESAAVLCQAGFVPRLHPGMAAHNAKGSLEHLQTS